MVDTAGHEAVTNSFDFGRVLNRTVSAVINNFKSFFLIGFIIYGVPSIFVTLFGLYAAKMDLFFNGLNLDENLVQALFISILFIGLGIYLYLSLWLTGGLTVASLAAFNNEPVDIKKSLRETRHLVWRLLRMSLLFLMGMLLGLILLIVPGIIFYCMYCVAAAALVAEDESVTGSLSRSSDLTDGYKWWVFLLIVIYLLVSIAIELFSLIPIKVIGLVLNDHFVIGSLGLITKGLTNTFTNIISIVGLTSLYYELRLAKEGIGSESIYEIFD